MNFLVIEDDPDVQETVVETLRIMFQGSHVETISDGKEFHSNTWQSKDWDIIITDLMLPNLTGIEVCQNIRQLEKYKNTPLLVMTGYDTQENIQKVTQAGANHCIGKPFEIQDFIDAIKRILENKK